MKPLPRPTRTIAKPPSKATGAWAVRSEIWVSKNDKPSVLRAKRAGPRSPSILAGHSASLKVDGNTLPVRKGFTHYPQKQGTYRYFKGDDELPSRITKLDGGGSVMFDALSWLAEQKVPLVRIDWTGAVDLTEPERPKVDRATIDFLEAEKLHPADFTIRSDGVVRLNSQLARQAAGLAMHRVRPLPSVLARRPATQQRSNFAHSGRVDQSPVRCGNDRNRADGPTAT
jgi:hypothetical protein